MVGIDSPGNSPQFITYPLFLWPGAHDWFYVRSSFCLHRCDPDRKNININCVQELKAHPTVFCRYTFLFLLVLSKKWRRNRINISLHDFLDLPKKYFQTKKLSSKNNRPRKIIFQEFEKKIRRFFDFLKTFFQHQQKISMKKVKNFDEHFRYFSISKFWSADFIMLQLFS